MGFECFRALGIRHLRALIAAHSQMHMTAPFGTELKEFWLLIQHEPLTDHTPMTEVAIQSHFRNLLQEIARLPR
jgi:hypothetical protein